MDTHQVVCQECRQAFTCDLPQPHTCKAICIPCLREGLRTGKFSLSGEFQTQPLRVKSDGPVKMVDEGMWFSQTKKEEA